MIRKNDFIKLVREGSFRELFITELGWNYFRGETRLHPIRIEDIEYQLNTIAERNGFQILYGEVDELPTQTLAKKIDSKLRRQVHDYICIYRKRNTANDVWVVPVRNNEKRDLVMVECDPDHLDFLYSKLEGFSFDMDELTNIVDLRSKVQKSFAVNSEKITKDFYAGFKKQHKAFAEFITGIDDHIALKDNINKKWFTSVMLNRLMFCYFIQKKGFLSNDVDYLRNKLNWVRQEQGENRFFKTFYKGFLADLFHDGLNSPIRDIEFRNKYGKIPYLNGGMFEEHQIEREYEGIDIDDEAFIQLFDFFDTWRWHLDTRITSTGKDINPDVLGYIFEQYINDRAQMGAYYTKEDITEYIGRNCILPFLFDKVATSTSATDFKPNGYVWETLKNSGDKYIFDAVKNGYQDFDKIPEEISCGIITEEMHEEYAVVPVGEHKPGHIPLSELRKEWNRPTPETWALPTEIWRETIDRLQRCDAILNKIRNGEITAINDFITYNLDIRSFASDLIAGGDSKFVKHFYEALTQVTILDPTCGSGAFLFAAMNILEPLYEVCIERMQSMHRENSNLFKKELEEINGKYRSNIQYFIYKSIILRNLYGVDIMVEATEIAKLRLFLKMVAVVEVDNRADNLGLDPLPDIDFNIRCGNTLVGYANKAELERDLGFARTTAETEANNEFGEKIVIDMKFVAKAYALFKNVQLTQEDNMLAFKQAKHDLRERLNSLNDSLNRRLHIASNYDMPYEKWLPAHNPFNWLAEFYTIIQGNRGFDVIIGNPPYVTFTDTSLSYKIKDYSTYCTKNLFALCAERFTKIVHNGSSIGYIIPLSGMSINGFESLQKIIYKGCASWSSFYSGDRNPAELFNGVKIRAGIYVSRFGQSRPKKYVCKYIKYKSEERPYLFAKVGFVLYQNEISAPKIPSNVGVTIINKISSNSSKLSNKIGVSSNSSNIYYHAAPIHWCKCLSDLSILEKANLNISDSYKPLSIRSDYRDFTFLLLNSTLFFFFWIIYSDCYNLTRKYFDIGIPNINKTHTLMKLADLLNRELFDKMQIAEYAYKNRGKVRFAQFFPKQSKSIIDKIDTELAKHYGFSEEELDFIINYDIKYRMGDELNSEG